jgi:hypothetical protein
LSIGYGCMLHLTCFPDTVNLAYRAVAHRKIREMQGMQPIGRCRCANLLAQFCRDAWRPSPPVRNVNGKRTIRQLLQYAGMHYGIPSHHNVNSQSIRIRFVLRTQMGALMFSETCQRAQAESSVRTERVVRPFTHDPKDSLHS